MKFPIPKHDIITKQMRCCRRLAEHAALCASRAESDALCDKLRDSHIGRLIYRRGLVSYVPSDIDGLDFLVHPYIRRGSLFYWISFELPPLESLFLEAEKTKDNSLIDGCREALIAFENWLFGLFKHVTGGIEAEGLARLSPSQRRVVLDEVNNYSLSNFRYSIGDVFQCFFSVKEVLHLPRLSTERNIAALQWGVEHLAKRSLATARDRTAMKLTN